MSVVPRERFVPEKLARSAYDDGALPIGDGQTISQPFIVAEMTAAAGIHPGDRVLEVGTGSGYGAAVLREVRKAVVVALSNQAGVRTVRPLLLAITDDDPEPATRLFGRGGSHIHRGAA